MPQLPSTTNKCVALTCGDPNSIAPLISLKAWLKLRHSHNYFILVSNMKYMKSVVKYFNSNIPLIKVKNLNEACAVFKEALPILNIDANISYRPSVRDSSLTKFILQSIDTALQMTLAGKTCALTTNPVDKFLINQVYHQATKLVFTGHTGYLAQKTHSSIPVMMMSTPSSNLKVIPLTTHISLKQVATAITPLLLAKQILTAHQFIKKYYKIKQPRYLCAGLNPHAGENSLLGDEEEQIILPTLRILNEFKVICDGPIAVDSAFNKININKYDIIFGMYHDQVLTPFKTLFFDEGVNTTIGLNIIRTSPDHGVAFNMASSKYANPNSLIAAIITAHSLSQQN